MNKFTRRDCMVLGLAATAAGCAPLDSVTNSLTPAPAAGSAPDSLNGLAKANGLLFGNCLGTGPSGAPTRPGAPPDTRANQFDDPDMRALMIAQCGILVPENELKWHSLRKTPEGFDFARADKLVDFAGESGLAVRGHTLFWARPQNIPGWVADYDFGANPRAAAEAMLVEHVKTVCGRYGKRIFSYDVINELIVPETGELEQSAFTKYLGPDVVDVMFHAAHEAAPHAQLVYNDYMSWEPKSEKHRATVLKLLERMKKNNVPVDALGIQAHIGSSPTGTAEGLADTDFQEWRKFLDDVTAMGIDLIVTEFDVNDKYVEGDIAKRDRVVADYGKSYLDVALSYPQLRYVMAWGIVDKYSWLQRTSPRPDGLPKRPCPYDDNFQPKLLREVMAEAFRTAPARPAVKVG
ncbi:MAG TPA: endo-1,4-beta-xylanase [Rhizomicrobium sp.]